MSLSITPDYSTYADAVGVLIQRERELAKLFAASVQLSNMREPELVVQAVCAAANLLPQPVPAST